MEILSAQVFDRNGAVDAVDRAFNVMELLRGFPDHEQAPVWRRQLDGLRAGLRDIYAHARLKMAEKYAGEDFFRANPGRCPRCSGTGYLVLHSGQADWMKKKLMAGMQMRCGCPLAEAMERGRTIEQDAIDRGIDDRLPDPAEGTQMSLMGPVS